MKVKYYVGQVHERNGNFEYDTKYLFSTNKNPDKYAEKIAMSWRGGGKDDWDEAHQGYWCDSTLIFNAGSNEISKDDFEVLQRHLTVL